MHIQSKLGFSLVSALVGMGLVGVIGMMIMKNAQSIKVNQGSQKTGEIRSELHRALQSIIHRADCFYSIDGFTKAENMALGDIPEGGKPIALYSRLDYSAPFIPKNGARFGLFSFAAKLHADGSVLLDFGALKEEVTNVRGALNSGDEKSFMKTHRTLWNKDNSKALAEKFFPTLMNACLPPPNRVPVGTVLYLAGSTVPTGYLLCNGDSVPNGTGVVQGKSGNFSQLYAVLGTRYGAPGQLPDLRGEFVRGADMGRGVDTGRILGSAQLDQMQSHTGIRISDPWSGSTQNAFQAWSTEGSGTAGGGGAAMRQKNVQSGLFPWGGGGVPRAGSETRPRNVALLPVISY